MSVSRSSSSSNSMPDLEEVNVLLTSVEAALGALDRHKSSLHQHADSMKQDISSAVERHMATLRAREKQLIRQVELVSTHQSCRLNVTQAQLLQHQGALAVTRTILHRCAKATDSAGGNPALYCGEGGPLCCNQGSETRSSSSDEVSNSLEDADLEELNFFQPYDYQKSKDQPKQASDKESDGRSEMCVYRHKSGALSVTATRSVDSSVDTCSSHRDVNGLMRQAEKLLHVPFISVTQLEDSSLNSAIQSLGCVTLPPTSGHGELLPLLHCELLPHSELLPHCLEEYGDADHHVLHKSVRPDSSEPIDVRQPYFLAVKARRSIKKNAGAQQSQQQSTSAQQTSLLDKNMAVDNKEDLVKWLRRMQLDTPTRRPAFPAVSSTKEGSDVCVEEACQGNETCSSFSECFLNGQCQKNAVDKADQSSKWRLQQQHLQLLHQNFLLHKLKKQQAFEPEEANPFLQSPSKFMPTNVSRKRPIADQNSAIQCVIAHMNAIQHSSNGSWLLMNGSKGLENSIACLNLRSSNKENVSTSLQAHEGKLNKKMRMDETTGVDNPAFRSAILYQAPTTQWRLNEKPKMDQKCYDDDKPMKKLPESEDDLEDGESRTFKNDWLLKKYDLKMSPMKSTLEKTLFNNEKENLFLADKIKSQMSSATITSIENLKERIDRLSSQTENKSAENVMSGKELRKDDKEDWLLQQSPSQRADNKILEEILQKKSEWLSTSSRTSFSVISESESRGSGWLLS